MISCLKKLFFYVLRKHFWFIAAILITIVAVVAVLNFKAVPIYLATSKLLVQPSTPNEPDFQRLFMERDLKIPEYLVTHSRLLQGEAVLEKVVNSLNLSNRKGFGIPIEKSGIQRILQYIFHYIRLLSAFFSEIHQLFSENPSLSSEDIAIRELKKIFHHVVTFDSLTDPASPGGDHRQRETHREAPLGGGESTRHCPWRSVRESKVTT